MILALWFGLRESLSTCKYPILKETRLVELDGNLNELNRYLISGSDEELINDSNTLFVWERTFTHIVDLINNKDNESDRIFIFPTKSYLEMFHIVKKDCKVSLRSTYNGSLENLIDWNTYVYLNGDRAVNEMLDALNGYNITKLIETGVLRKTKRKAGGSPRENILTCQSYRFIGDTATKKYHKKGCRYIDGIVDANLVGLGTNPEKKGWIPCPSCVVANRTTRLLLSKDDYAGKIAAYSKRTKAQIIEEQIALLCQEFGMHAEFKGGTAFITTVAGEWFFVYNDRPIKLRHRNYSDTHAGIAKSLNHYHKQSQVFPSPLHVIKYIRQHEIQMKRRIMEEVDVENYLDDHT